MDDNTIVSTRIRLARNIDGLPFPHKLNEATARQITDGVEHALSSVDRFTRFDMNKISNLDGTILQEKHLISPDLLTECPFGSVLIGMDETVSIMVNEEDHIREQVILPGLSLERAYNRINMIDDAISNTMKFAFSPRYGYLTACATNLGTGMRASVMMFLPALTMKGLIDACINDVGRLNMTVRGIYGEGSNAEGYLYQVSNQRTLGITEGDILDSVGSAINHIVDAENRARELLKRDEPELKDKIFRAYGLATNAYKLTTTEAMHALAMIRLGAYYGYISVNDQKIFTALTTKCLPANMQKLSGKNIGALERDILRAQYIAAGIKKSTVKND
ncbi:MAG: protein arginine kinase [Clostridiales bacterium]|nr:protein arginine kinase [Clostridiales bacterium]